MLNITSAAQQFLNQGEQNQVLTPTNYEGVEHLLFDIVDFSDQEVKCLIDGKYVIIYVIRDTNPHSWEQCKQMYIDKCLGTSTLYADEIRQKLVDRYGEQKLYIHIETGEIVTSFDWESHKSDFDESQFVISPNTTIDYACASKEARDMLWSCLTAEEIEQVTEHVLERISSSFDDLQKIETCTERPFSVHVFNETSDSFTRVYEKYSDCLELVRQIHLKKLNALIKHMVIA